MTLYSDSGVENVNGVVDALLAETGLRRILAQVEVVASNSMIERFWSSLRHQWLYLHSLDNVAALRKLVAHYVEQHNTVMPHGAFQGQTPDEVYFGKGDGVPAELAEVRRRARAARIEKNRAARCGSCTGAPGATEEATTEATNCHAISGVSQLRTESSRMS